MTDAMRIRLPCAIDTLGFGDLIWPERRVLFVAVASAILGPVAALTVPFAAKLVIDEVIGRRRTELLLPIAIIATFGIVLHAATEYTVAQAGSIAGQRAVARLRQRLHRHVLELPVGYFDATPTGNLVARCIADADQVRTLLGPGLLPLVSGALTAVLAFAVLAWLDWQLATFIAFVLALVTIKVTRGFDGLHSAFRSTSEHQASLAGRLTEVFGGIRVVKTARAERREALVLTRESHRLVRASVTAHRRVAALGAGIALANGGVSLGLLVLGGQAVARSAMTLGDLALCVFLVGLLSTPLVQLAAVGGELGRALVALARVREVLALPTERNSDRGKTPVRGMVGAVTFDRVSYRYGSGLLVLRDVSFVAEAGATTALVGPNGAGKTTLLSLLLGFDDPTAGCILVDGRVLTALRLADYRKHLGVVLQRDQLIDGTISENIRYARPDASAPEFQRAAYLAHCDEFVARLPQGFDTRVGERGVRLSGGERQRVAIARAFLAGPRILLLDEATTHLDGDSEPLIQEAVAALCQGRTTFVIAHRLATIQRADQILVFRSGTLMERGTHEELLARRGQYWQLNESQAEAWQAARFQRAARAC